MAAVRWTGKSLINATRILELFRLFDPEHKGVISKKKFIFTVFPEAQRQVYEKGRGPDEFNSF